MAMDSSTTHEWRGSKTVDATRVGIPDERRTALIDLLNARLATATDLYSILPHVDRLVERATALGSVARGTTRMAAEGSSIDEMPDLASGTEYVEVLVERYATHANEVRDAIDEADSLGDEATVDLFVEIVRDLDKSLYFLQSHLQE